MKFSKSPPGLWRAHKESLASKQPVSSTEYQWMNFERIFEEKNKCQSSRLQHFHNWGRRLWRPALIAMVEVVEQQSSNLALWADGACPWHPDTPRYTQWVIISSDHFLLVVQMPSMAIDKDQHLYNTEGNKSPSKFLNNLSRQSSGVRLRDAVVQEVVPRRLAGGLLLN